MFSKICDKLTLVIVVVALTNIATSASFEHDYVTMKKENSESALRSKDIVLARLLKADGVSVREVVDKDDFTAKLTEAGDKLVFVDFYATWCGPCEHIAPLIEELAKERPNTVFLKINVDKNPELVEEFEIQYLPTFFYIKKGVTVHSFYGANIEKVKAGIEKYE